VTIRVALKLKEGDELVYEIRGESHVVPKVLVKLEGRGKNSMKAGDRIRAVCASLRDGSPTDTGGITTRRRPPYLQPWLPAALHRCAARAQVDCARWQS